ncbi:hypothetical protein [Saccharopolyspora pogona]|nr:hypothetical protein [Saccharopolyspora pogona]
MSTVSSGGGEAAISLVPRETAPPGCPDFSGTLRPKAAHMLIG